MIVTDVAALSMKSEDFNFTCPQMDPIELAAQLVKEMVDEGGIGLSAVQIGIPLRAFAIRAQPQHIVLFNPIIVNRSDETKTELEGCLSFPNLLVKVKRNFEIRCRFKMPNQEVMTQKWGGLTARVVQHEMDHLDGILFYNRANRFHRDQAFRKRDELLRLKKQYDKMNPPKKEESL
jgi:peptide deformylase